ncbi:MAG: transcription elongation factor GreA [Acholeplasmatales bacterium]|nr:transcription elongation factor GreA [Acholeplasmatales bacterium]
MINNQIDLTINGKLELEAELDRRKNQDRTRIKEAIKEAREQGDLSENADYAAAREEQAANEAKILEIENILKHARIIEETKITVRYVKLNKIESYEICGSESNPFEKKISNDSPLARAVSGRKPGDRVFMTTESGKDIELELISIE